MRGGPYTDTEVTALVGYCETDVDALEKLLPAMADKIDLPRALLRGRYMQAVAKMEWAGTPIDVETLALLRENWVAISAKLVAAIDKDYGIFVPTGRALDPSTRIGQAIIQTAGEWGINPYRLAEAVEMLWTAEGAAIDEQRDAVRDARKRTGLTVNRISTLENQDRDHADVLGLDDTARDLAGEHPELAIGPGYRVARTRTRPTTRAICGNCCASRIGAVGRSMIPGYSGEAAELVVRSGDDESFVPMSFSAERFAAWLVHSNIPWPQLESGELDLSDDTFRQQAKAYPAVAPLRELRAFTFAIAAERTWPWAATVATAACCRAFASRTGRNQPSNARFIFGPSVWLRGLIQPTRGRAVAYSIGRNRNSALRRRCRATRR